MSQTSDHGSEAKAKATAKAAPPEGPESDPELETERAPDLSPTDDAARSARLLSRLPFGLIVAEAASGRMLFGPEELHRLWSSASPPTDAPAPPIPAGLPPDHLPDASAPWPIARSLRDGETVRGEEVEIRRADDTPWPIQLFASPIRDHQGEIIAAVAVLEDLAERRRLTEREQLFAAIWDHAPVGIALYQAVPGYPCLRHNQAFVELILAAGGDPEVVASRGMEPLLDPGAYGAIRAIFERVRASGESFAFEEFTVVAYRGAPPRSYKGSVTPVQEDGQVRWLLVSAVEVTDLVRARHAAEEAHRRSEILARASRVFAESSLDFHVVLHTVTREIALAFRELCVLRLVGSEVEGQGADDDPEELRPAMIFHPEPRVRVAARELVATRPLGPADALQRQVVATGEPLLTEPLELHWGELAIHGLAIVPLRAQGQLLGTITLLRLAVEPAFQPDDLALLQELADRAALAVQSAKMLQRVVESEHRLQRTVRRMAQEQAPAGGQPPAALTARERQVVRLIAHGLTNAEIGRRLGISLSTTKAHVEHILAKLGASDRAEAAALAATLGLLDDARER